jgi:hypothetical protein
VRHVLAILLAVIRVLPHKRGFWGRMTAISFLDLRLAAPEVYSSVGLTAVYPCSGFASGRC